MLSVEMIQTFLEYNEAMQRRTWSSIQTISDEQFVKGFDYSHGSIRDLMMHITIVEGRWLRGLQEEPDARSYSIDMSAIKNRQDAFELWEEQNRALMKFTSDLDKSTLERTPIGMSGPAWQVLLHLVNHATDHRSQVLRLLDDFGAPTFDQDFILYQWFTR